MSVPGEHPEEHRGSSYGVPARRKRITELLTEAYARDDLEQREFELRIELVEQARTVEELDQLIADFPSDVVREVGPRSGVSIRPESGELEREVSRLDGLAAPTQLNVLGDQHIALGRMDPRVVRSVSVIGDCAVDLRGLSGEGGVILVKIVALIGDTRIIVPRGTPVDIRLLNLIGDQKRKKLGGRQLKRLARQFGADDTHDPDVADRPGPTVVVTGVRLIGDTEILEE